MVQGRSRRSRSDRDAAAVAEATSRQVGESLVSAGADGAMRSISRCWPQSATPDPSRSGGRPCPSSGTGRTVSPTAVMFTAAPFYGQRPGAPAVGGLAVLVAEQAADRVGGAGGGDASRPRRSTSRRAARDGRHGRIGAVEPDVVFVQARCNPALSIAWKRTIEWPCVVIDGLAAGDGADQVDAVRRGLVLVAGQAGAGIGRAGRARPSPRRRPATGCRRR